MTLTREMEISKQMIEMALNAGRHFQSKQTGFVHYFHQAREGDPHQAISLYHNFLFVLALFRSRIIENINEGKGLLDRLLIFQNQLEKSKGNFPVYLHDYPNCWDHFLGIYLLTPFFWILKYFGHILGQELKGKVEVAAKALFNYAAKLESEKKLPFYVHTRLSASKLAFGELWKDVNLLESGNRCLQNLQEQGDMDAWDSTESLSHLLIGLQMVYSNIKDSPWQNFWKYVVKTWHYKTCTYIGPCIKEKQLREEPQVSLYDYLMNYFSGQNAARIKILQISQLEAALIHPSETVIENGSPLHLKGIQDSNQWSVLNEKEWGLTLLEWNGGSTPIEKIFTPFRFVFGDSMRAHTFVSQGNHCNKINYALEGSEVSLFFHSTEDADLENRDRQKEINFYLDFHEGMQFFVAGASSNTFKLGEKVEIRSGSQKIEMVFDCLEGDGQFLGHISKGNRPSQIDPKGDNKFHAYDWHFFIRTVRRKGKCVLRARITNSEIKKSDDF